ncbi:AAA family ATPase, partial [Aduncisulcus paluster]
MHVDGLVVVSEPSMRSFQTASEVGRMASGLGLENQVLVINRYLGGEPPKLDHLPENRFTMPQLPGLVERQISD